MERQMIKTFEEKKAYAELMRNIFGITAVLYIGFMIWTACLHHYEILWWEFNVWMLLVCIAVKNQGEKVDAELILKYIEYIESRDELIDAIGRNHPWISVKDSLPENNCVVFVSLDGTEYLSAHYRVKSKRFVTVSKDKQTLVEVRKSDATYTVCGDCIKEERLYSKGEREDITAAVTHWMPIPKLKGDKQ